jgi:uncharacterized membrane protein YkoI
VLGDWFKQRHKKRPDTAISEQRAVEIAREAAAGQLDAHLLTTSSLEESSDNLTWTVGTAAKGSSLFVRVDATTGAVVEMRRIPGR